MYFQFLIVHLYQQNINKIKKLVIMKTEKNFNYTLKEITVELNTFIQNQKGKPFYIEDLYAYFRDTVKNHQVLIKGMTQKGLFYDFLGCVVSKRERKKMITCIVPMPIDRIAIFYKKAQEAKNFSQKKYVLKRKNDNSCFCNTTKVVPNIPQFSNEKIPTAKNYQVRGVLSFIKYIIKFLIS